ncbi:unnamed protein product [Effrenium voratum]|uniref:Uncharacterized protein n=1 Tax=Effrenium voratum TaxID=2562239 RepID=A0AA36J7X8_9DINO|nr:unnamed protein product [Effrenium voratum]
MRNVLPPAWVGGLTSLALGSRATLVARAIAANTELGTEMMGLSPEQRFLVDARIDQDTLVTVYNAELSAAGQLPRLHLDNHAGWIAHSKPTRGAFFQLKELCAGLGGFSQKANFVGIKTVACLDHSRLACDALRRQGHQVVHAQMEDMEASWYLQSVGLILECVHNARHNVDVQNLLEWPIWSNADESNLQWTLEEEQKYGDPQYGNDLRFSVISSSTGMKRFLHPGEEYQHKLLQDRLLRWITPSMFMPRTLTLTEDGEPDALVTLDKPTTLAQLKKAETSLQGWGAAIHVYPAGYNKTDNELITSQVCTYYETAPSSRLRAAGLATADHTWDETVAQLLLPTLRGTSNCGTTLLRTDQAIAKLGTGPIQKALKDKNCWQALKALASRPATRFRWILYDELQAMHFINDAQSISTDALAIITTSELPTQPTVQQAETIRFPAVYTGTNEPVLLTGSLIQIGDTTVKQVTKSAEPLQDEIATATIRVSVFAPRLAGFRQSPDQVHRQEYATAQKCPDASCSGRCGKFHPAIEEPVDYVMQDVWAWTYASADGKRTAIEHCVLFHVAKNADASKLMQLEVSVQELRDQSKRFENWFHEVSQHGQKQAEDLKLLQQVVTQQQGDLTEVKQQIRSQGDALQAAVGNIKHDLSSQIDTQFQRFEALLAKKSTHRLTMSARIPEATIREAGHDRTSRLIFTALLWVTQLYSCAATELLAVGTTNPSGLNGKEDLQIQRGPGIWHLAETQLSHVTGAENSRSSAVPNSGRSDALRVLPHHSGRTLTGLDHGLGCSSLQTFQHDPSLSWDAGVFETGRITTARHIFDGVPITTTAQRTRTPALSQIAC